MIPKKVIGSLLWLLVTLHTSYAQDLIKKEKIYTLTSDEVVAYEENSLGLYQDELGYIVVTADVKKFSRNYHIDGKIYGPFDRRLVEKPVFNLNSWGFIDSREDVSYVVFNGKEIGIYKDPLYPVGLKISKKTWAFVLINQVEGNAMVNINGKEFGPFNYLHNYHLSEDGERWAISYYDTPEEYYILFSSGEKLGPYKEIIDFEFLEGRGNRYVLTATFKNIPPKIINGQEVELFTVVTNTGEIGVFEKELVNYPAYDYKALHKEGANYGMNIVQDQKIYYLANDELYGPYKNTVGEIDMGKEYNQFNYIDLDSRTLHFKGDGIFSYNVKKYFVSESRKTVNVVKKIDSKKDSLFINDKYFKGIYNTIEDMRFSPGGETWVLLSNNSDGTYSLSFSDGRTFGPFPADISEVRPTVLIGKEGKNWALYYKEGGTKKIRLYVNSNLRNEEYIGNIAITLEEGKEYFSWFSLENKTVYLNKLLLE